MAITAQSIVRRATDLLQDQTSVRWPANELVRWLNDAQRAIAKLRPDSMNTTTAFRCAAGTLQSLLSSTATGGSAALTPAPSKLIEITRNVATSSAKKTVTLVPRNILDAQIPGWHAITPVVNILHYMFDARDPKTFYVYPPATTAAELELRYSAYPTDITEPADGSLYTAVSGNISLPDIYADDILNFMLFRCYSKDSEYAGNTARASAYQALLISSLGDEIKATLEVGPKA